MPGRERDLLERFAFMALAEQRRTRRWSLVFLIVGLCYLDARKMTTVDGFRTFD